MHIWFLQDECSFVSLRDIERAMIVMKWFHSMLDHIEKDDVYTTSATEVYMFTHNRFSNMCVTV